MQQCVMASGKMHPVPLDGYNHTWYLMIWTAKSQERNLFSTFLMNLNVHAFFSLRMKELSSVQMCMRVWLLGQARLVELDPMYSDVTWRLLGEYINIYHIQPLTFWSGSSYPTVTSDPLYGLWEKPKFENLNIIFAMVKMYPQ